MEGEDYALSAVKINITEEAQRVDLRKGVDLVDVIES